MTRFAAAGLFFDEWYRDPIFRALAALPLIGIVAFVTALAVRRRRPGSASGWRWRSSSAA